MGIRGLETFVDRVFNSEDKNQVFTDFYLSDLKLVIDGNQFVYTLTSIAKHGHYGGNYDQFYSIAKNLLIKLKPSIQIIIFDGAKESTEKCRFRLEQRVKRMANLTDNFGPKMSQMEQLMILKEHKSLFNRHILFNLLNELDIYYEMSEGAADHVIALYANGHNPTRDKFIVMSKASFFNIYNLEKGYLSTKYALKIFQNLDQIDQAKFPVFFLNKLLNYFCLESHKTWIYFCIMLGNNDDPELKRNSVYFKEYKINISGGCMDHLIAHLKLEEKTLLESNFSRIRTSYIFKQEVALKKIDQLIELFEMKNSQYRFAKSLISSSKIDDFDRIFLTITNLNSFFISCLVENYQEDSVFQPSIDFIHCIYGILFSKSNVKFSQIDEFVRTQGPTNQSLIDLCPITSFMFNKACEENKCLNVLNQIEQRTRQFKIKDNLTLLFFSLAVWENWLERKIITFDKSLNAVKSKFYLDAVIANFLIVKMRHEPNSDVITNDTDFTWENLFGNEKKCKQRQEILTLYNRIIDLVDKEPNLEEYFEIDINFVHRLNEFQAIYYILGALSKLNDFKFEMLEPNKFLNSYFCVNYVKMMEIKRDENNNLIDSDFVKIDSLLKNCENTLNIWKTINAKLEFCKRIIFKNSLKELLNCLRI